MIETTAEHSQSSSKFFDAIDSIDRYLYGRKMKNFILGAFFVIVLAPILDDVLEVPHDRLTFLSTLVFMFYVLLMILAWLSAWRDDHGKWTLQRAKSKLITYYETFRDTAVQTKTNSKDETLYNLGAWLFFGGMCWKAMQNLSVFVRKPTETFTHHYMAKFRKFEDFTQIWSVVAMALGIVIMGYLYRSNPQILKRIKKDLRQLFGRSQSGYGNETIKIDIDNLVIQSKREEHIQVIATNNTSSLFRDFTSAIKTWNPGSCKNEYEYQDKLFRHLKKSLPDADIETEFPIGSKEQGNRGRADIVINDTILIEMKRDSSAGAIQRAKGQISQYSLIWNNRGPVILLLCNYDYEHAKLSFTPTMMDLTKLDRPVLTIVAEN